MSVHHKLVIFQMDPESHTELQAARIAFYRLQQNFNHNVLVIDELEEKNKRLQSQNESIKTQYHQAVDQMQGMIEQLNKQNGRLSQLVKSQVQRVRQQCDEEMQRTVYIMNQRMMEEKQYEIKKINKEKNDIQIEAQRFEDSLRHFSLENSTLIETVKQLRLEKQNLEDQLSMLIAQKETYSNKFLIHEKELENMRNANEEWQQILKEKVKQANKEKQKVEEELSEAKLSFKLRLKSIKQESNKRIQEIEASKEKLHRIIETERNLIKDELKQANERKEEVEKNVERLKVAIGSAQKQIAHSESKIKKLQRELREARTPIQTPTYLNYPLDSSEYDDRVDEHHQNKDNDYSRFLGGGIDPFRIDSSVPREIQDLRKVPKPHHNISDHLFIKKIGQLQIELEQFKGIIKSSNEGAQRMRQSFSDQIVLKQKQINLCRDEIFLLREKITDQEQQLLALKNVKQQLEDKSRRVDDLSDKNESLRDSMEEMEKQIDMLSSKCEEMKKKLFISQKERLVLEQINVELRAQIHQFNSRVKVYDQLSQDSSQSEDEFQQMEPTIDKQQKFLPIKAMRETLREKEES